MVTINSAWFISIAWRVNADGVATPRWVQTRKKHDEMSFEFFLLSTLRPNPIREHRHISRIATVVMI